MIIQVTQEHIAQGVPCVRGCCPIALAMESAGIKHAVADWDVLKGIWAGRVFDLPTPASVEQFMEAFDSESGMVSPPAPFSFVLAVEGARS